MCKVCKNRVVIIGGTSGIGLETGYYLKDMGYDVIIAGRRSIDIEGIISYNVNICSEESVSNMFNTLMINNININALIYAAGITTYKKSIVDFDEGIWNNIVSTNVTGLLFTLKYLYPVLKKNNGRVVIINSLAARSYSEFSGIEYTMSKAALSGFVRQMAIEWAKDNVLINSVYPSMTMTPMLKENVNVEKIKQIEERIPLGRIANPIEIARAIEFLINPKNTYITGAAIDICGGQYLNG